MSKRARADRLIARDDQMAQADFALSPFSGKLFDYFEYRSGVLEDFHPP
jgi:hypothetical protein